MKTVTTLSIMALLCCAGSAMGADLTLTVNVTGGTDTVAPGGTVTFEIVGELSTNGDNTGLALFGVDMSVSGPATVNLETAATISAPAGAPMEDFVNPDGLNNPTTCGGCFGFGGTASGDVLLQIGGGQNTIGNTVAFAAFPIGDVSTNVAFFGTGTVLAEGSLTAPLTTGIYNIDLTNGFANVITALVDPGPPGVYSTAAVGSVTVVGGGAGEFEVVDEQPSVEAVASVRTHTAVGDLALDLVGTAAVSDIEPRFGGITTLEVAFDTAMDAGTQIPGNVLVTGTNSGGYGGSISVVVVSSTVMTVGFDPALGFDGTADCWTVDLGGMQAGGAELTDPDFVVLTVMGDLNRSGATSVADYVQAKIRFGQTADASNAEWDYNLSGGITTADAVQIKVLFGTSPGCP